MARRQAAPSYKTRSGWNALLPPRVLKEEVPAARRFDTIIIGAGYTGLAAARRLAELRPSETILLLESSEIGEGASGRNSGYLLVNPGEPSANAADFAEDWATRQMGMAQAGFDSLKSIVEAHGIACNWREDVVTITSAATPAVERDARKTRETYLNWGLNPKEYVTEDFERIIGSGYYRYGLQSLTRALVQPAALHRGLADTLPANVTLLEKTVVEALGDGTPFQVKTTRGAFTAGRVLLTNNLHSRALGVAADRMIGTYTYGAFTPELDDEQLALLGQEPEWGILPAHRMGTTMRKTMRRLLIRSGDTYERELDPADVRAMLTTLYKRRFPQMRSHALEHVWGGLCAITHNGGTTFGEMRPGLYASVGCGGAGVVRGSIHGKLLAELSCGVQSPLLSERLGLKKPNWLPPEPFRGIGARTQMAYENWHAGLEK